MSFVLCVVGSRPQAFDEQGVSDAKRLIGFVVNAYASVFPDCRFCSGGAPGVDTWFEEEVKRVGRSDHFQRIEAKVPRWDGPGGYRERNVRLAHAASRLICIQSVLAHPQIKEHTYGAGWTHDFAKRMEKDVSRYWI